MKKIFLLVVCLFMFSSLYAIEENDIFRAKVKARGNKGRDYLESMMNSWAVKHLTGKRKKFSV